MLEAHVSLQNRTELDAARERQGFIDELRIKSLRMSFKRSNYVERFELC